MAGLKELILSARFWLVTACVVVQLRGWSDFLALQKNDVSSEHWLHLVTYAFAHGGWLHLGLNSWVLLNFGPLVERQFGRFLFLILFFAASIFGGLLEFEMNSQIHALMGASAGLCGIVAVCLLLHPEYQVLLFLFEFRASWALIFICWGSLIFAFISQGYSILAHWAHIGGLVVGLLWGMSRSTVSQKFIFINK